MYDCKVKGPDQKERRARTESEAWQVSQFFLLMYSSIFNRKSLLFKSQYNILIRDLNEIRFENELLSVKKRIRSHLRLETTI